MKVSKYGGPEGPRIAWLDSQLEAGAVLPTGVIPILVPSEASRRARWVEIFEKHSKNARPDPVHRFSGRHVIGSVGLEGALVGRPLAAALRREFISFETTIEAVAWARNHEFESLLVIGLPAHFHTDALVKLHEAAAQHQGALGFVTAKDVPGLGFAAAKVLLAWTHPVKDNSDHLLLDYVASASRSDQRLLTRGNVAGSTRIRLISLRAHGDGAHLDLDDEVLCGLTGDQELSIDGRVVPGCAANKCKKAESVAKQVRRGYDVNAAVVILASCNSFCVAGELFPSDVSLVLGLADGEVTGIVATIGQLSFSEEVVRRLINLVDRGLPLGRVPHAASTDCLSPEDLGALVVWGDPLWSPLGADRDVTTESSFENSSHLSIEGTKCASENHLVETHAGLLFAESVEQGLIMLGVHKADDHGLKAVSRLVSLRKRVQGEVWGCVRERDASEQFEQDAPLNNRLTMRVEAWDEAFGAVAERYLLDESHSGARVGDLVLPLLHAFHGSPVYEGRGICDRCESPIGQILLRSQIPHLSDRRQVECFVCGPLQDSRAGGTEVKLKFDGKLAAGEDVNLLLDLKGRPQLNCQTQIVMQMRDKSKASPFWSTRFVTSSPSSHKIPVPIPPDAGFDLFSARVLAIHGMNVDFARSLSAMSV